MKNKIFILLVILFASCSKPEPECKDYQLFIESTEQSAKAECQGLANSHPEWKIIEVRVIPCLTQDELILAQATGRTVRQLYCPNVWFEVRTIIR
jgi:uncharacterized lipoprotein YmbA